MPKSVFLLRTMDLLRERPGLTVGQLAAEMGRSERTVYRYLETLCTELHVPVYCQDSGYYITERSVEGRLGLSPKEALIVRLALSSGAADMSGPFVSEAQSAWRKIEAALAADSVESVQAALARHSIHTPAFSEGQIEPEVTSCLATAIERNKCLSVVYRSQRSGETRTLVIEPYALVFRRHNWYLAARSHSHGRVIQLKVVRIVKASQTGETFLLPHDFSVESFYAKAWEIYTGGEEEVVRVKFSPRVAPIIRESKRHPTQELKDTPDGGVIFCARVAGIEEIGFWILSWGPEAEVLEPPELRSAIEEAARQTLAVYAT